MSESKQKKPIMEKINKLILRVKFEETVSNMRYLKNECGLDDYQRGICDAIIGTCETALKYEPIKAEQLALIDRSV